MPFSITPEPRKWVECASTPRGMCLKRSQSDQEIRQDVVSDFMDVFPMNMTDHFQVWGVDDRPRRPRPQPVRVCTWPWRRSIIHRTWPARRITPSGKVCRTSGCDAWPIIRRHALQAESLSPMKIPLRSWPSTTSAIRVTGMCQLFRSGIDHGAYRSIF